MTRILRVEASPTDDTLAAREILTAVAILGLAAGIVFILQAL